MLSDELKKVLKKQHYGIVGNHTGVQICRWTKKSLIDEGVCYKEKFYGIKSHLCCQMSPSIEVCENQCLHCWRAIELGKNELGEPDKPEEIIEGCIEQQKKLINGFKGNKKVNTSKFKDAQEPMQFAISLSGEPTLYPYLGEMINILRKKGKTSFVVTNGLNPDVLSKLNEDKNLPTQLYLSLNSSNEKDYVKFHRSSKKNAWKKFNETLELFPKLKTRKVIRMTLIRGLNMSDEQIKEFALLIKKANPDFIECKGFMSVGFARERLGYDKMPNMEEIRDYAKKMSKELGMYKVFDEQEFSRVVLLGRDKSKMKIKKSEI